MHPHINTVTQLQKLLINQQLFQLRGRVKLKLLVVVDIEIDYIFYRILNCLQFRLSSFN